MVKIYIIEDNAVEKYQYKQKIIYNNSETYTILKNKCKNITKNIKSMLIYMHQEDMTNKTKRKYLIINKEGQFTILM